MFKPVAKEHPVTDFLEDFEVTVGEEVHVGVILGHASNSEVHNERTSCWVGKKAGDIQVWGSIQQGGTCAGNLRQGLDGVIEGVHRLED